MTNTDAQWRPVRLHPRLPVALPVEIGAGAAAIMGETVNLSAGGLLIACRSPLPDNAALWVRFNLPTGDSIHAPVAIVHRTSERRVGVQFVELANGARSELSAFTSKILGYSRRGARTARRVHLTIRRVSDHREDAEEMAETVMISAHGGLLVCRARFQAGEDIFLWWPEKKRGTKARVVSRQLTGKAGLVELGFEFVKAEDFWGTKLTNETGHGRA